MQAGEAIFVIALNCIIIFTLYRLQQKSLEKRIKHLKKEIQDLEDLVAAIIEEFEEIAAATDAKTNEVKKAILDSATIIESGISNEIITDLYEENTEVGNDKLISGVQNISPAVNPTVKAYDSADPGAGIESVLTNKISRPVSDSKHQRILDLWEQGVSIEEIAKNLGTGRGEVQLILGIYRRS